VEINISESRGKYGSDSEKSARRTKNAGVTTPRVKVKVIY